MIDMKTRQMWWFVLIMDFLKLLISQSAVIIPCLFKWWNILILIFGPDCTKPNWSRQHTCFTSYIIIIIIIIVVDHEGLTMSGMKRIMGYDMKKEQIHNKS